MITNIVDYIKDIDKRLRILEIGISNPYGGISAYDTNTSLVISGTGIANKVQITAFDTNDPSSGLTPDYTNDHIVIDKAGKYHVVVSIGVESSSGTGYKAGFAVYLNNGTTLCENLHVHRNLAGGGGDSGSINLNGIVSLAKGDTVELWVWNETNTTDIIIDDATISVLGL